MNTNVVSIHKEGVGEKTSPPLLIGSPPRAGQSGDVLLPPRPPCPTYPRAHAHLRSAVRMPLRATRMASKASIIRIRPSSMSTARMPL